MAASAPMLAPAPEDFGQPSRDRRRRRAVAASFGLHALVLGGLLFLGGRELEPVDLPVVRLVFDEPAPPPLLGPGGAATGAPGGTEPAPAPAARPAPVAAAEPAAARAPTAPRSPAAPRTRSAAKPRPAEPVRAAAPPAAAAPAPEPAGETAGAADVPGGTQPAAGSGAAPGPGGDAAGSEAGSATGRVGGTVGGLGSEPLPAGSAAVPPAIVSRVMPEYPEVARMRGEEGQVMLEAVIGTDGRVEPGVKVIRSIPSLDRAAVEAFRRWRFQPARDASGRPIRVILQAPVRFVLR